MSGGVDSSVAAHLLVDQGHEVIGVFMRHGEQSAAACAVGDAPSPLLPLLEGRPDHKQGCCSASDADDARRVADRLGIPFYALDLQADFREIIDYFVDEYLAARTPNPCVMCNNQLKFGRLFDYADSIGAEYVATGHYAQLLPSPEGDACPGLFRGIDGRKDQSYVLFGIDRARLARMLLPVGGFAKTEIRQRAAQLGLRVADKRDSQEICFVTSGKHDEFIRARRPAVDTAGEIVTTSGEVVGRHAGIEGFTIGQRRGIGVAMGEPHFVVRIESASRQVVIGPKEALARGELLASRTNWLVPPTTTSFRCTAQIRYNSAAAEATASVLEEDRLHIHFDEPHFGIAPGQAVVCYRGTQVLGGGWID